MGTRATTNSSKEPKVLTGFFGYEFIVSHDVDFWGSGVRALLFKAPLIQKSK